MRLDTCSQLFLHCLQRSHKVSSHLGNLWKMWLFTVDALEILAILLLFLYLTLTWLIPCGMTWFIRYKYNLCIQIGWVSIYMGLRDVYIKTNDFWIAIEKCSWGSSLFNKHAPKLLTLNVNSVKVYWRHDKPVHNSITANSGRERNRRHKLKAPDSISNLVQFLGIYIDEVSLWGWEAVDRRKALHLNAKISGISIDGCTTVGEATVAACIVVKSKTFECQITENFVPDEYEAQDPFTSSSFRYPSSSDSTVKHLTWSFDFRLDIIFSPRNSGEFMDNLGIDVENLFISWEHKDRFLTSFGKLMERRRPSTEVESHSAELISQRWISIAEDLIFTQAIPKEVKFRVFETQCEISDDNTDFMSNLSGLSFTSKCIVSSVNEVDMVTFESQLDLGLIRIEPDRNQSFSIDQFSNYFKLASHTLTVDLDISNLAFKSFQNSLVFDKAKLKSNLELVQQFPRYPFRLERVLESVEKLSFESSELQIQYNENRGSFSSALIEVVIKDLSRMWTEDNVSVDVVVKELVTEMNLSDDVRLHPVCFQLLGFELKGDTVGSKLCGGQFQWVPKLEELLVSLIPTSSEPRTRTERMRRTEDDSSERSLVGFLEGAKIEVFDTKVLYMAENGRKLFVRRPNQVFRSLALTQTGLGLPPSLLLANTEEIGILQIWKCWNGGFCCKTRIRRDSILMHVLYVVMPH